MSEQVCPFCSTPLAEHPAGRCMDAWLLHVKGYTFWERYTEYGQEIWVRAPGKEPGDEMHPRDRPAFRAKFSPLVLKGADLSRMRNPMPPFDWADAGLLMEEMADPRVERHKGEWRAECWTGKRNKGVPVFVRWPGDTGPHAIERAFIAWKEGA